MLHTRAVNMFIQYIPQACNKRILVTRNHKTLIEKHEKETLAQSLKGNK
jgi:hypothetical protein